MSFSEIRLLQLLPFSAKPRVFVDVGAHQGSSSAWFAEQGWRVLAFEPEPTNRRAFEMRLGHLPNVTCLPLAVSDVAAEGVPFFTSAEHFGIHALKPFHPTHAETLRVDTTTLDQALRRQGIDKLTFLKIDVEGADFLALKGLDLKRFRPEVVMLEYMDPRSLRNFGYGHKDVVEYMRKHGYVAYVSEWAPIVEYARAGQAGPGHKWLRCGPYPPHSSESWGNLIFVSADRVQDFEHTLQRYLRSLVPGPADTLRGVAKQIPGARPAYRLLKKLLRAAIGR